MCTQPNVTELQYDAPRAATRGAGDREIDRLVAWPPNLLGANVIHMKLTGTIRRNDLEGGLWTIETDKGDRYQLVGETGACKDGMKAEVDGKVEKNMMGIGMAGPSFTVEKIKAL